jgi:hypothetical protein
MTLTLLTSAPEEIESRNRRRAARKRAREKKTVDKNPVGEVKNRQDSSSPDPARH